MSSPGEFTRAASAAEVRSRGCTVVHLDGHALALFAHGDRIYAVDNRCPHMGFPLDRGTVKDGILTCHWHHARFDLESGCSRASLTRSVAAGPRQSRRPRPDCTWRQSNWPMLQGSTVRTMSQ